MFKSVFLKYISAFMLIYIGCMLILFSVINSQINIYSVKSKTSILSNASLFIAEAIEDDYNAYQERTSVGGTNFINYVSFNSKEVLHTVGMMNANPDKILVLISDIHGNVLLSGGYDGADELLNEIMNKKLKLPSNVIHNLKSNGNDNIVSNLNGILKEDNVIYARPVRDKVGDLIGAIVTCSAKSGVNQLLQSTVKAILVSSLWLLLAGLIALYIISERLVSPLRAMSRAAKEFAAGRFDVRVPVHGKDEVSELAKAFNNMASSLETNEETRRLFLANVSHDLRTPMTTISGFIDGILDGAIPAEKQEYYLGIVAGEVRRLSRLVSALLDITRIQAGERKFNKTNFDICELCRQVMISSVQRIEEKELDVRFSFDQDNMFVFADEDAIHQVVYNLVDNAVKFSCKGGVLEIKVEESQQKIEVSVFNEGQGISDEDMSYIFDRFYKGDKSRGLDKSGTGLGLFISRTIIEAHGEKIKAESEYGSWCKFTFTLEKGKQSRKLPGLRVDSDI